MLRTRALIGLSIFCLLVLVTVLGAAPQGLKHDPNNPEAIPIVIAPDGFLQTTFSLPAGSFFFVLLNRTGLRDITVYLERVGGSMGGGPATQQIFGEQIGAGQTRLTKSANLNPGNYRLRVANRPDWVCVIPVR